ncbi:hypothetical protein Tco_0887918 [Tanacetum coccineum]
MLKDKIDNGPYQFKSEINVKDTDGVTKILHPQILEDLAREDKLHYDSNIKAINILLLGLLVNIYTLINHYQTTKEIWDRVKELMEGTKMTKQERYSRFSPINNQVRTSSNPRTQATIQNGQVTIQNVQGHIAKQCTGKKRVKDSEWFKDKMLLAQVQKAGVVLNDEQQDFLTDSLEETDDYEDLQLQATTNFKVDHVDVYDSDCDDEATANAILMANLSPVGSINEDTIKPRYDSDILFEVPHYDTYHESDVLNSNIQELEYIENIVSNNEAYDELTKVKEMKDIFEQMEDEVDQCSVAKRCFEIEKKQLLINNDQLLEENISCDSMCTYLRSLNEADNYGKCKSLDIVLLDLQESNKSLCELRKRFAKLEEYIISLDIAFQNHKEKMINDSRTNNNNHLVQAINNQSFEINNLKVQLQDKTVVINELKH